jgi:hypothetical protein
LSLPFLGNPIIHTQLRRCTEHVLPSGSLAPLWLSRYCFNNSKLFVGKVDFNREFSHGSLQPHKARVVFSNQDAVGKPLADHGMQHVIESFAVAHFPVVVPECLLIDVARQVEGCHGHVGAFERALEQRPEILQAVRVDAASDVFGDVIDPLVEVSKTQCVITRKGIGEDMRSGSTLSRTFVHERVVIHVGNTFSPHFPAAFQQPLDNCLAHGTTPFDFPFSLAFVHVPGLPADECFIDFDLAGQLSKRARLHCKPDTVKHEPRRFLSYFQCPGQFTRADAILRVSNAPDGDEPLVETKGTVLEDRADLHAELLAAILGLALQERPGPDDPDLVCTTFRTDDFAVWPLSREHGFKARFWIREVTDGG